MSQCPDWIKSPSTINFLELIRSSDLQVSWIPSVMLLRLHIIYEPL